MVYRFSDCELDEQLFQLRRGGRIVKLEPKVYDVLAYLVRHRDRVVSKNELLDAVWPGQAVSESVLPKCVTAARRGVGDTRAERTVIATVHGRGYRFVAAVQSEVAVNRDDAAVGRAGALAPTASPPFVGRESALASGRAAFDAASTGQGRVVLLVGEPGIGKTRTADEIAAAAQARGAVVAVGRSLDGEGAPAFWPWVQVLRTCVTAARAVLPDGGGALASAVTRFLPELGPGLADHPVGPPVALDQQARFRVFDDVTTFLQRVASRCPLVIVLDDLHWADEASLRLLAFLVPEVRHAALLVLGTYRDVEVGRGHPLEQILPALAQQPHCERITLRGLADDDVAGFIERLSGTVAAPRLVAAVHEMTEGNPFFVQEIVRLLMSEGRLAAAADAPGAAAGSASAWTLTVPQSLRAAIGRRLSRLSTPCGDLLRVAAVLGREFAGALLARVTARPLPETLSVLDEAVTAGLLDSVAGELDRYAFHHALIRRTLYDELGGPQRILLHRRVVDALDAVPVRLPLAELAHHAFQAAPGGDVGKAVELCARAAATACAQLAYEESVRWYDRALQALALEARVDERRRAELLLALGEACSVAGLRDRARAACGEAADVARRLRRPDLLARAALGYRADEMGVPPDDTTLAMLEEALAAIGIRDGALRARLLSRLAGTPPHANAMENRAALAGEALALARAAGDRVALRDALSARLWAALGPDGIDDRLAAAGELIAVGEAERDPRLVLFGHDGLFGAHLLRGDMPAARAALVAYTRCAADLRQPAYLFQATFWQGSLALATGAFDTAAALFREARARGRGTVPYAHFMFTGQMYSLVYRQGSGEDPELQRVFFGEMLALPYAFEHTVRSSLALARALGGDRDACRREFERVAAGGLASLRRDEHWLITVGVLADVAVYLDDGARAAELVDLMRPYAGLVLVHDLLRSVGGTVFSSLGDLATLLGRYDEAEAHFERAMAQEAAMGILPSLLDSYGGYCRMLLQRGRAADVRRARGLFAEAESRAAAIGLVRYRHRESVAARM